MKGVGTGKREWSGNAVLCSLDGRNLKRQNKNPVPYLTVEFFASAIEVLQTLVIALGAGLGVWGLVNLLEGYGNDNPGANACVI